MKNIIKASIAALAIAVAGVTMASAEQIKVGVAAEPYPPFTSPDASGKWSGWEIDFIDTVCAQAKLDCVITPVAWDGIIPALNTKKIDMIVASMSDTPERRQTIDFSDKYYQTETLVIGPKDEAITPTPEGLAGKTLGVQVSTIYQTYAQKHFAPKGVTVKEYQTQDEANNDLVAGRLDAVAADSLAMKAFLATDAGKNCCDEKGAVVPDAEVLGPGVAIGLRKGDTEFKDKLNAAIKEIRANGAYDAFSKKYFDFDIYGD